MITKDGAPEASQGFTGPVSANGSFTLLLSSPSAADTTFTAGVSGKKIAGTWNGGTDAGTFTVTMQ